ncbi:hypothetical protein [Rhizobium oryzicola]|uniref:Uncharacterized protein n=1 Tax=Rhizobium oryzicola TaxID=1232668 RepID=A0ABT8SUU2_9HYPH|nr:hypothetical protein [Rhizobium oryzicola]MDO1582192.1 hypothetical protein [Rhizobium oryzicola]
MAVISSAFPGHSAPATLFRGTLFADYFQVYLADADHLGLPDEYTAEAVEQRLMAGPYAVVVHTARNMGVPVTVEWHAAPPAIDPAYQHVVEAVFSCPSGTLILAGLMDDISSAHRLAVPPGFVHFRVSMAGLDTLSDDGLDGDDRYLLQLWPGRAGEGVRVLKAWRE